MPKYSEPKIRYGVIRRVLHAITEECIVVSYMLVMAAVVENAAEVEGGPIMRTSGCRRLLDISP